MNTGLALTRKAPSPRPVMSGAVPVKIVWESEEGEAEMAQRLLHAEPSPPRT